MTTPIPPLSRSSCPSPFSSPWTQILQKEPITRAAVSCLVFLTVQCLQPFQRNALCDMKSRRPLSTGSFADRDRILRRVFHPVDGPAFRHLFFSFAGGGSWTKWRLNAVRGLSIELRLLIALDRGQGVRE